MNINLNNTDNNDYVRGYKDGKIAGATAEIEYMRPVIEAAEKVAKIFAHKGDHQTCAICQLAKAIEQWKGTGKGQFTGSTFADPAPGITLGCISPEARNLLDTIMEAWEKHYAGMKEMHGAAMPETTFYGFAYWLVRWSGLIQPASTNPQK